MSSARPATAREMACALLETVGMPSEPGINVFELAHRAGITVRQQPLSVDGRLERLDGVLQAVLSTRVSERRKRFTLAHELCHGLLGDYDVVDALGRQKLNTLDIERFCNEFAAELLMPRGWVEKYRGKEQNFAVLNAFVEKAQVSNTAALVRLTKYAGWSVVLLFFDRRDWSLTTLAGAPPWARGSLEALPETKRIVKKVDRDSTASSIHVFQLRRHGRLLSARAELQSADHGVLALASLERGLRKG